jgi:hypothetical protein
VPDQHYEGAVLLPDGTALIIPHRADAGFIAYYPGPTVRPFTGTLPPGHFGDLAFMSGVVTRSGKVLLASYDGPDLATFDPASGNLSIFKGPGSTGKQYKSAVLLADGESALLAPFDATTVIRARADSLTPVASASRYAGGLLLPNGDALLVPNIANKDFLIFPADGGAPVPSGNQSFTGGYYSATWSTNGFAYAIATDSGGNASVAVISRSGAVVEQGETIASAFTNSHFGFVARSDGVLVGCPTDSSSILFIDPTGRRTVDAGIMTSPWLNKF